MNNIIIVAPHADDEIIGCHQILCKTNTNIRIIYTTTLSEERRHELTHLTHFYDTVTDQLFSNTIPPALLDETNIYYFPDPIYELHPDHRAQGAFGEQLARQGYDVVFYSTNMNVPWIHEIPDCHRKEEILNNVYPSQRSLWQTEKKYILFEGRVKWLF
jgi:hypothetical protein